MDITTQHIETCSPENKFIIDLDGPEGNVFYLMGAAKKLSKRLDLDYRSIQADMQESDYAHAVKVFQTHFGDYVELKSEFDYKLDEIE